MGYLWSLLTGRGLDEIGTEKRLTVDDWAQQVFQYQNNSYPIVGRGGFGGGSSESAPNDFEGYVQSCYKSDGIVFACMLVRQMVFSEARFQYQRIRQGRPGDLYGNDQLRLLERPWPNGTTGELLSRAVQDADLAGNHYVVREGAGKNARLRRLRPDWVEIILTAKPEDAVESDVAGYLYKPGNSTDPDKWKIYPIDGSMGRVAHWSPIPDPIAQYRGMSWMTPVIREIMADKAATQHKAKFFDNAATPNLAVSFKESVTAEQFKEFKEAMDATKGGIEHAYETLYLGGGADVTVVGADLRQMDFKNTQGAGETRIAAAARVNPVIVGLSEGMQGSSLNSGNFKAAKDQFGDATMRPLWRSISAAYEALLDVPADSRLWYDDRDISFLRTDRMELAEIQATEARTIGKLVQEGYTHDSVIAAVLDEDWRLLKHTGLFSVQLQPPFQKDGTPTADTDGDGKPDGAKAGAKDVGTNATGKAVPVKPTAKPAAVKPAAKPAATKPAPPKKA